MTTYGYANKRAAAADLRQRIRAAYEKDPGLTLERLAQRFGCSASTISKALVDVRSPDHRRRTPLTQAEIDEVRRLYDLGWSWRRLEREFHCNYATLRRATAI